MLYLIAKAWLSGVVIMAASEVAKRSPTYGALLVSLPLVSILAMIWLWRDTGDNERIAALSEEYILARVADAADVPRFTCNAKTRFWVLDRPFGLMRTNRGPLSRSCLAPPKAWDQLLMCGSPSNGEGPNHHPKAEHEHNH